MQPAWYEPAIISRPARLRSPQALSRAWKGGVSQGRKRLTSTRKSVKANIDALTRRLARLQAHVIRIDALGRNLVQAAGLDAREFDFGHPIGEGGPDTPDAGPAARMPTIDAEQNRMARTLDQRGSELQVLRQVVMLK